ncbi:MAG: AAA family ATPase [Ferrimicrobium sp.]
MRQPFPFSAIVGQEDIKEALLLIAVDPTIGGVVLVGEPGSAKTTLARGLGGLLGESCPFVELPLGATEDRVAGSIDLAAALGEGTVAIRSGLLGAANGGVLYIDEINLLPDHIVDLVLDAAATGVNRVERDGVSAVELARFALIGSMNPEEGELRPQLLDRMAMVLPVVGIAGVEDRSDAVRHRIAFDRSADEVLTRFTREQESLQAKIKAARAIVETTLPTEAMVDRVVQCCHRVGVGSLRSDIALLRAVRALAALDGRADFTNDDLDRVAPLVLSHRPRRPMAPPTMAPPTSETPSKREHPAPSDQASSPEEGTEKRGESTSSQRSGDDDSRAEDDSRGVSSESQGVSWSRLPTTLHRATSAGLDRPAGVSGESLDATAGELSLIRSVVARLQRGGDEGISSQDLRYWQRDRLLRRCVLFVIDVSASVAAVRAVELVDAAVDHLLTVAYQSRAQVAIVGFGGSEARVILRPTRSLEVARGRLASLERQGRTPLASGLRLGAEVATGLRRGGVEPLLVVLSDARANFASGGADPFSAARLEAETIRTSGFEVIVVDLEDAHMPLRFAAELAETMDGTYLSGA